MLTVCLKKSKYIITCHQKNKQLFNPQWSEVRKKSNKVTLPFITISYWSHLLLSVVMMPHVC